MKRPWAFICASEGATSKHLRNYCREVYLLRNRAEAPKDHMPKLPVKIRRKEKVL